MAESKDLLAVLWSGADVLRGKMDANEYKTYLLGLSFYKYLSDKYLETAFDLYNGNRPEALEEAQEDYEKALREMEEGERRDYLASIQDTLHYILEPEMTFVSMMRDIRRKAFQREKLQAAFNRIQESDALFQSLFADVDLYSNRLGIGDQKQSDTIADIIKVLDGADLIHAEGDVLGNAYEYLIGQFASETGKKAGEFYTPNGPAQILCRIAMTGQEEKKGLQVYAPCMQRLIHTVEYCKKLRAVRSSIQDSYDYSITRKSTSAGVKMSNGKWVVLYSSVTKNTQMIAEQIAKAAGKADIFPIVDMPEDLSSYKVVAIGYWLRLGAPDPLTMKYLPKVHDSNVILFQTHGADPGSEHAVTAFARAAYLLGENCEILGTFGCQGRINPAMIEKRKHASPDDPHAGEKAQRRWERASSHPNEEDLAAATKFVEKMKCKLSRRKKNFGRMPISMDAEKAIHAGDRD